MFIGAAVAAAAVSGSNCYTNNVAIGFASSPLTTVSDLYLGAGAVANANSEFVHASTYHVIRPNATNVCDIGLTGTRYNLDPYFSGSINANQIITAVYTLIQFGGNFLSSIKQFYMKYLLKSFCSSLVLFFSSFFPVPIY